MLRSAIVLLTMFSIVGFGCKKSATTVRESDGGAYAVTIDGHETQVRLYDAGAIPPEFPPGTPLYPGANFSSTARTANDVILMLTTSDSPDAVFAFYRKQTGFKEISDLPVGDQRVLHLKHVPSGKDLQVVVKVKGAITEVSLVAPLS